VHVQDDGLVHDLLVLSAYLVRQLLDRRLHLQEITKFLSWQLLEKGMRSLQTVVVDHSNLQGSTGYHALLYNQNTLPLGRKSMPTICSMRLLLPEL
jgi:hypothetical protein